MGLTTNVVRGKQADRLLVLLHGLGSDERDLAQLVPHLDPDGRFVALMARGPYSAPPGYAWFQFGGPPTVVTGTMRSSMEALDEAIDSACDLYGMQRSEAVFGGFSQGCMLALALSFRQGGPDRPAAVLGMSGSLPPGEASDYDWTDPPAVLLQHGVHDPLIPVSRARQTAQALAENKVPVVYREYQMDHAVSLESIRDAKAWLDRIRAGERPSEPLASPEEQAVDELVMHVSSATFEAEVLRSELPVVVDFWAPWCGPCRQVEPVVRQMATMRKGRYKFAKVNIDEAPDLAQQYQVQSIPLVALFRNGRLERKSLGAKPRQQLEAELGMLVIP